MRRPGLRQSPWLSNETAVRPLRRAPQRETKPKGKAAHDQTPFKGLSNFKWLRTTPSPRSDTLRQMTEPPGGVGFETTRSISNCCHCTSLPASAKRLMLADVTEAGEVRTRARRLGPVSSSLDTCPRLSVAVFVCGTIPSRKGPSFWEKRSECSVCPPFVDACGVDGRLPRTLWFLALPHVSGDQSEISSDLRRL